MLHNIKIKPSDVQKLLLKLKINKASGPDGLHPRLLHDLAEVLAHPLADIFTMSLSSGEFLSGWKDAHVSPIFKKGNHNITSNYRPISLTAVACKAMETLIRGAIIEHLRKNYLLSKDRHGFIGGRSCTTNLLEVLEDWTKVLDEGGCVDVIYLDFMKAFDTVPHKRLLKKLEAHGIIGQVLKWIEGFLTGRRQRVIINGIASKWAEVTSGIPQGSVLGPILFVIFINDLPDVICTSAKLFADDTKVYDKTSVTNSSAALQSDLNNLVEWSETCQIKFHLEKTLCMRIGRNTEEPLYTMTRKDEEGITISVQLKTVEVEKDLRIYVDSNLDFKTHINQAAAKANRLLDMIWRSFEHLNRDMISNL